MKYIKLTKTCYSPQTYKQVACGFIGINVEYIVKFWDKCVVIWVPDGMMRACESIDVEESFEQIASRIQEAMES